MESEVLTARAPADLSAVSARLHDQILVLDGVEMDRYRSCLVLPILVRDLAGKRLVRSRLLGREYLVPLIRCTLKVEDAREYFVRDDQGIRFYCLENVISPSPSTVLLTTSERTSVTISVASISVVLSSGNEVVGQQSVRRGILGQEFGRVNLL